MFKWLKKVINNNSSSSSSSSDLNDGGLQNALNDLYIAYDKILTDNRFGGYLEGSYKYILGMDIKGIISDTIKLTGNHPELLLHLDKLNEYVFKLKMATTTLLDIYDNKDNLAKDVYKQQKSDAKEIIIQLAYHISDCNKKLSGLYQDENSATINFLKKQMGMTVDDPQEEDGKLYKEHGAGINGAWKVPIGFSDEDLYEQVKKLTNDPEYERQIDNKIEEAYANKIYSDNLNANKLCSGGYVDDTNRKIKQAKKITSKPSQGNTARFVATKEEKDDEY